MKRLSTYAVLVSLTICLTAQTYEFYEPLSSFQAERGALERKYTLKESQEYYDRIHRHFSDWLNHLETFDYDDLTFNGKMDYVLFRNHIEKSIFFHSIDEKEFQQVQSVTGFAGGLYQFVVDRRRGGMVEGAAEAALFSKAAKAFSEASAMLSESKPYESWLIADKAAEVVKSLRENVEEAWSFYYGYHPLFTWWTETAFNELNDEMMAYEENLRNHFSNILVKDDGSGIIGKPEGREALMKRLEFEFIPYTPEELLHIGQQEFNWCRNEIIKASKEMGYGNDWSAALEYVKDQYVEPGEQPAMINRLAEEAIAFIEENELMTVPEVAKETWRMRMMSPEAQLMNPFFLGGEVIIISYPTNTMSHDQKMMSMRGNNPHFCMATVHHELIAGHHYQGFVNQRNKPYRRPLETAFWSEGWALYWEFIMYEKGLPTTPEDRMGFLFWRIHRAARIIFSLKYHLGEMTPQECIDFLVDEVGHERANAEAEVRRSFMSRYDPLYQLAYMIGGIQFMGLRKEMVDSGKMSFREFHDEIMRQNSVPVEILRKYLLQEDIPQDFKSSWRFYETVRF
jgi:uncharacterized protein (DUF885 family)